MVNFCNDGSAPLRVPGFADIDYGYELPFESRFSTIFDHSAHPNITARELSVLRAIDRITDKENWAAIVQRGDAHTMSAWYAEAHASSTLINERAWAWIVRELYDKATSFLSSGNVLVFDTCATGIPLKYDRPVVAGFAVCKSDSRLLTSLSMELQQGTASLYVPTKRNEIQAGLNYQVNPAMFPLVFDKTPVLIKVGESTKLHARHGSVLVTGQGCACPATTLVEPDQERLKLGRASNRYLDNAQAYSINFQWLPCEVEFRGGSGSDALITSYINNLHSIRFQHLYGTISKLVSVTIEPWNQVLVKAGRGRTPLRILTFGIEYCPRRLYGRLPWVRDVDLLEKEHLRASAIDYIERFEALPFIRRQQPIRPRWGRQENWKTSWRDHCNESHYVHRLHDWWSALRSCPDKHPQIGQVLTYDAWKGGAVDACIIPPMEYENAMATSILDCDFLPPPVVLQDTFRQQGLQVFVKLESFELTPASPRYTGTDWGIQGVGNEHIVAVAVFYYSIENIDDARLSFLHKGGWDKDDYDFDYDDFEDLAEVIAIDLGSGDGGTAEDVFQSDVHAYNYDDGQRVGAVSARQGRLLTYPNYLLTRMEPFELHNKTEPGHLRSLTLCLVDPHYRICSTRNVAPQQPEYWFDQAMQAIIPKNISLPQEIMELIRDHTESWPISAAEAVERSKHKRELPKLRTTTVWAPCSC